MSKYGNKKTQWAGKTFDSKREAERYAELVMLQKAGEISDLKRQVPFELFPTVRDSDGKVLQRSLKYVADFTYRQKDGSLVVEDVKGYKTQVYQIKKKLMLWQLGIRVVET